MDNSILSILSRLTNGLDPLETGLDGSVSEIREPANITDYQYSDLNRQLQNSPGLKKKAFDRKFLDQLDNMGKRNNWDLGGLLSSISFESKFNPKAVNPTYGATGLIQMLPSVAEKHGIKAEKLKKLSGEKQLPYIEKYLKANLKNTPGTPENIYTAILAPAHLGKEPSTVVLEKGKKGWVGNENLDVNKDGKITIAESLQRIRMSGNEFYTPKEKPSKLNRSPWSLMPNE